MVTPIAILKLSQYIGELRVERSKYENIEPEMTSDLMFADEAIAELDNKIKQVEAEIEILLKLK